MIAAHVSSAMSARVDAVVTSFVLEGESHGQTWGFCRRVMAKV